MHEAVSITDSNPEYFFYAVQQNVNYLTEPKVVWIIELKVHNTTLIYDYEQDYKPRVLIDEQKGSYIKKHSQHSLVAVIWLIGSLDNCSSTEFVTYSNHLKLYLNTFIKCIFYHCTWCTIFPVKVLHHNCDKFIFVSESHSQRPELEGNNIKRRPF